MYKLCLLCCIFSIFLHYAHSTYSNFRFSVNKENQNASLVCGTSSLQFIAAKIYSDRYSISSRWYIFIPRWLFWWINMAWKISLEVQRLATFTLWIHVFMTTVSFAPLSFDTQKFCIPSKLWPHGRTVEWWSKRTGPRCVGNQVAKCSGVSIWSHTSQKNPKKKMLSLHVGVFAHVLLCV